MTYQKAGIYESRLDEKSGNLFHSHRDIAVSQVLLYSDKMLHVHVVRAINEAYVRPMRGEQTKPSRQSTRWRVSSFPTSDQT